jgi:hypothetical protein
MTLVRPVGDIASFPAPGWTTVPLWSKVNTVDPDDLIFISGLAPGAQDPQVALSLGDLEIPFGASGRIIVRVRMRWSGTLSVAADTVRIGLGSVAALALTDPALLFERSIQAFSSTEFETVEVAFDYTDFAGGSSAMGIYVEMTPNSADAVNGHISWIEVESCVPAMIVGQCQLGSLRSGEIIDQARDMHISFHKRAHPHAVLLRLLSRYQRELTTKIAELYPAICASEITVPLPLEDFNAGIELPSHIYVLPGVEVRHKVNTDLVEQIEIVNLTMRSEPEVRDIVVYIRGNFLFLSGREETWDTFSQLGFHLVATPKTLTTLDDPLIMPDYATEVLAAYLAKFMAMRGGQDKFFVQHAMETEKRFLEAVAGQGRSETYVTRDTWPGGF